jgi:hypothetical protein
MHTRNTPLLIALLGIVVYLAYTGILLTVAGGDLLGLMSFGEFFVDADTAGIASEFIRPRTGYDGQFYYRLAQDTFSIQQTAFGITLDDPPLRQQRMLLPLLTSIITRGEVASVPIVMLFINILAVGGCGWAAAHILQRFDCSPWYGVLFVFYPGFAISVGRFLTEPLAFLLMLFSLLALINRRNLLAAVMLSLAVVSRETATLLVASGFFTWFIQKHLRPTDKTSQPFRPTAIYWLLPCLTFFLWQAWLYQQWGRTFLNSARGSTFGFPGAGFVNAIAYNFSNFDQAGFLYLLMILLTVVYLAYLLPRLKKSPDLMHISIYAYLLLAVCVGFDVWVASPGFFRVFTELSLLGLLAYLMVNKGMGKTLPLGWLMVWLVTSAAEWYRLLYWQQHYTPPPMVL